MKIAVMTDSASGFLPEENIYKNLILLPIPFTLNGEEYYEDVNITKKEFYERMNPDVDCHTSQTPLYTIKNAWDEALKEYDYIIHMPISSGLSMACNTAMSFAENEYKGKVFVVNNQRVSITLKSAVIDALEMIDEGYTPQEICDYLNESKLKSGIYILVDTLVYLKKGGRITPAAAAFGSLLNIKPILQIQGGKLDAYKKVISLSRAKKELIDAIRKQINEEYSEDLANNNLVLGVAHTNDFEGAEEMRERLKQAFPTLTVKYVDSLSLAIAIHTGPKALGVGFYRKRK